jgi:signal transduction histidine kinase/AmiR/NasT family two-component response regulator
MQLGDWTEAQGMRELMAARRKQAPFRLSIAGAFVAGFIAILGDVHILIWGAVYVGLQGVEALVFRSERIADLCQTKAYRVLALAILAANIAVFASVPFLELDHLGSWGVAYGEAIVSCTFLNIALTTYGSKRAFLASLAPGLIYLIILPIMAWRMFDCPPRVALAVGTLGVALVLGTLKLWSQAGAAHEAERQARLELQRSVEAKAAASEALAQALARAEAANDAKSAFLATMSHEIRTPLNGVLGMVQAMAVDELIPVQRDRLGIVRQSGETLLTILNDVLDLSKIETGRLELESIVFSLSAIAAGCQAAFANVATSKGLSFVFTIDDNAQGVYRGDPTRVRQILYNLLSNAMKFTEAGEVGVRLSRPGEGLVISVKDTGMGMTPTQTTRVFQKFTQADASTTRKFGGTGLGLAIARELALAMGGDIEAESVLGEGATFTVRLGLPWVRVDVVEPLAAGAEEAAQGVQEGFDALRVLVAEDNAINQLVVRTLLQQVGVDPFIVANGKLALEAWAADSWDVILMDVQMPEMDGPTATRSIREQERRTGRARTPIVALTANAMTHQIAEYVTAGMDGHVAKPIEASRLFDAIERALEQVKPATAARLN